MLHVVRKPGTTTSPSRCGPALSIALSVLAGAVACAASAFPEPPDVGHLLTLYDSPDGTLTEQTLGDELGDVFEQLASLERVDALRVVSELAVELEANPSTITESADGSNLLGARVRIVANVRYRCRGGLDEAAEEVVEDPSEQRADFGSVELTALADLTGLDPTLWGSVNSCTERSGGQTFSLDGEVTVHLTGKSKGKPNTLVVFDGEVSVDGSTEPLDVDLERRGDGTLRVRHTLASGGSVLVIVGEQAPDVVRIRDSQGTWRCTRTPLRCRAADGARVLDPGPGM